MNSKHKCKNKSCPTGYFRISEGDYKGCCSIECATQKAMAFVQRKNELARRSKVKAGKKETAERKAKLKSRSAWLKEAQIAFNAYIRARDEKLPCVSCGSGNDVKQNAGHYRSVGSCPALRFEPLQVWKQCEHCNSHLSANLINYRIELLRRVGQQKLDWIEGPHEPKKYTVDQIIAIKKEYKQKLNELTKPVL